VRVLGVETSSRRGTVALVEGGRVVLSLTHDAANAHAERLLPLVEQALSAAAWPKSSLDRVSVGTGPGSFTGLRVGIALAQGIGIGLGRPVLGVGSLRAMCRAVPAELPGLRCALLDARRSEVFIAVHDAAGAELVAPRTLPREGLAGFLAALAEGRLVVGEVVAELGELPAAVHRSELSDLPHAAAVALLGEELSEAEAPPEPVYVRPADAIRPNLPRSPLSSGEPA
jgi:tRNA threonylcarbamoyladenosine biosynthesis protein TsaB